MKKNQINHNALTHLIEAGAVSVVIVKAVGDTWALTIKVGDTLKIVMAKNSGKPRVWRKLDTLAKYLKDLGVEKFHTDVSHYDPSKKSLRRPDSANTLKQTHKSHQALQKQSEPVVGDVRLQKTEVQEAKVTSATAKEVIIEDEQEQEQPFEESQLRVSIEAHQKPTEIVQQAEVSDPTKLNTTDKAIQKAKDKWEERRAKILHEENPRAK